ncbi:MAG: hypothetical protein AAGA37_20425 [Actinomycetota bacterium]
MRNRRLGARVGVVLTMAAPGAVLALVIVVLLGDRAAWWHRPGFGLPLPDSWQGVIGLDFVWMVAFVAVAIVAWEASWSDKLVRPTVRHLAATAIMVYVAAGTVENLLLIGASDDFTAGVMDGWAPVIVWASNTQLAALIATVLSMILLWTIPPPGEVEAHDPIVEMTNTGAEDTPKPPSQPALRERVTNWIFCREDNTARSNEKVIWHGPAHRPPSPEGEPHPWDPDKTRLGIAVSGGGIRSASFALGALQQLRHEGVLRKARYVTSVSGGGYTTSALTALNFDREENDPAPFMPNSDEEQSLRRSLRYLVGRDNLTAVARILLGLLINITIVYALIIVSFRPIGWLIGTPLVQDGLRIDGPVAMEVLGSSDDPDLLGPDDQPFAQCAYPIAPTTVGTVGREITIGTGERAQAAVLLDVSTTDACVRLRHVGGEETFARVRLVQAEPGLITFDETGTAVVAEQPTVELADFFFSRKGTPLPPDLKPSDVVAPVQPTLAVDATGVGTDNRAETLRSRDAVSTASAASVEELSASKRRAGPIDIDDRHWKPAAAFATLGLLLALVRSIIRPDSYRVFDAYRRRFFWLAAGWAAIFLVFPWLAFEAPGWFNGLLDSGRISQALPSWVPVNGDAVPPIIAFLILAASSINRFLSVARPKRASASTTPQSHNRKALVKKLGGFVQAALTIVVLLILIGGGAVVELAAGAANGPSGTFPWTTLNLLGRELPSAFPDLAIWTAIVAFAAATVSVGESHAWSPAPIYKRRLSDAFHLGRSDEEANTDTRTDEPTRRTIGRREYKDAAWAEIVPIETSDTKTTSDAGTSKTDDHRASNSGIAVLDPKHDDAQSSRAGYLDGGPGDGTELVLCMAANVNEARKSPTGRQSVSFTASRSYIGGPEVGWLPTWEYRRRLTRRRGWDVNLPGLTAISGAAVSPAMGKMRIGQQVGRLLALLNVRLGVWLPHPQWVVDGPLGDTPTPPKQLKRWHHNPGWPWYLRELRGKHAHDAPYLYVSDGGHWENLAIVEAMRRGCTTIVAISAAGDGPHALSTFAEAVEIARADLGIEVVIDDIWKTRQPIGDPEKDTLDSGRQYVLDPSPSSSLGRVAQQGFAFGTFEIPVEGEDQPRTGQLLVIDAAMVDGLPPDVHSYAETHPEFPNISTGDQLFTDRDFEAYRVLGRELVKRAMRASEGAASDFHAAVAQASRTGITEDPSPPSPPTPSLPASDEVIEVGFVERVTTTFTRVITRRVRRSAP